MAKETKLSFLISAVDKFTAPLKAFNERMDASLAGVRKLKLGLRGLAREGGLGEITKSFQGVGKQLHDIAGGYAGLMAGAGGAGMAKMLADTQTRFTRIGIAADLTDEQVQTLKQSIYDMAAAPDIRVNSDEITAAIEGIIEKTGDLKFAQDNIRNIGLAIQATGASGKDIGEVMAEFQKQGILGPKEVLQTLDILNQQGKSGAFTLQNIAALGPRVMTAYTASGRSGVQAMREMGAALQLIRMGTGSAEMAATAFEATMRSLADPAKLKLLEGAGLKIFDPEKLKAGQRVLRPINEIMVEIIKLTKGDQVKLGTVFDAEAIRAFNAAASEFKRTGSLESLDKFMQVNGDGTATLRDSTRAARDMSASWSSVLGIFKRVADEELSGPLQSIADIMNAIGPGTLGAIAKGLTFIGVAFGALALGQKVMQFFALAKALAVVGATLMATPLGWIIASVAALAGLAFLVWKNWEPISEFFSNMFTKLAHDWNEIVGWISDGISAIGSIIPDWLKGGGTSMSGSGSQALEGVQAMSALRESRTTSTVTEKQEATVIVDFKNAPRGTRVESGGDANLDLSMGYAMAD